MAKHKVMIISIVVLSIMMISACTKAESTGNDDMYTEFSNWISEKVIENYEDGNTISKSDIIVDQIQYGSFSQKDVSEILVLCKIQNLPHAAGLDKTVGIILAADTLEMLTYKEFPADKVAVRCFQTKDGQERIIVSKTATYQGISTQYISFFAIQGNEWIEMPIEDLDTFGDEYFCFIGDDMLIVASTEKLTTPADIIAVLNWNPDTEQFVLEH